VIGLGIDIGGSGIKGAPVDLDTGDLAQPRKRIPTPEPAEPAAVAVVVREVVEWFDWSGPVGCTVPGVVQHGVVRSAANIDASWVDTDATALFGAALDREVVVLNDADAAGLAAVRYGTGREADGVVLFLTFGTGIGSALLVNRTLVPNTEFGHLEFRGMEAEQYAAARLVKREEMRLDWWASRVNEYLLHLDLLFSPDLIIFGGGISKRFDDIAPFLDSSLNVQPAKLRNNAGIVGAAGVAAGVLMGGS
jgi:polyphosphate glucokinase